MMIVANGRHRAGCLLAVLAVLFLLTVGFLVTNLGACEQHGGYTTTGGYCAGRTAP